MIIELMAARQRDAERIQQDKARIDELLSKVNELLSMQKVFVTAKKQLDDYKQMVGTLLSKITALEERLKVCNKNLYASKSQKGINKKKREAEEDHTRDKDNFDSTLQSIESSLLQHGDDPMCEENAEAKSKEVCLCHQGLSYRTMGADNTVCHNSDIRQLPAGAIIIKHVHKYAYEQISKLEKTISYINTFWTQLFAYLNDGSYSIDNSIAERFIRPLAGERKNSLFFGSDRMARVSAVYHTIISTCKMQGVSVLDYFKRFFSEIVKGRRDYEHLLPLTIGLE